MSKSGVPKAGGGPVGFRFIHAGKGDTQEAHSQMELEEGLALGFSRREPGTSQIGVAEKMKYPCASVLCRHYDELKLSSLKAHAAYVKTEHSYFEWLAQVARCVSGSVFRVLHPAQACSIAQPSLEGWHCSRKSRWRRTRLRLSSTTSSPFGVWMANRAFWMICVCVCANCPLEIIHLEGIKGILYELFAFPCRLGAGAF